MKKINSLLAVVLLAAVSGLMTGCDFPWDENDEKLERAYQSIDAEGDVLIADNESTIILKDDSSTTITNQAAPVNE